MRINVGKVIMKTKGLIAAGLLKLSLSLRLEVFREYVQDQANELLRKGMMEFLDREGYAHCAMCEKKFPLFKIGEKRACPLHEKEVRRSEETTQGAVDSTR